MRKNESPASSSWQKPIDEYEKKIPTPLVGGDVAGLRQQPVSVKTSTSRGTPYEEMRKSIRTSAWWLIGWAVFSIFGLNISWAIVLATVGLMSFYFYDAAAMFLVYAGILLWAAVWNLLSSTEAGWIFAGLIQVVFTVSAYGQYRKYRNSKADHEANQLPQQPSASSLISRESPMAWLSLFLGAFSLVGLCGLIPAGIAESYLTSDVAVQVVDTALWSTWEIGVLGIPVGIAAIFTGVRPKAAAVGGIVLGCLSVLTEIAVISLAAGA